MKRTILIAAIAALVTIPSIAGEMSLLGAGKPVGGGGGGGTASCSTAVNTEVVTWGSNVDTQAGSSGAVSATQCGYVDTFVTSLKSALGTPLSSQVSRVWLATSADTTSANIQAQFKVDIIHGSTLDFTSANIGSRLNHTTGYTPNGTSEYIKTGFIPSSSDTSVYASGFASFGVYILSSTTNNGVIPFGTYDGTSADQLLTDNSGSYSFSMMHTATTPVSITGTPTSGFGLHLPSILNSTTVQARQYQSSTPLTGTSSGITPTLPTTQLYIGARNNQGSADSFSPESVGAVILMRYMDNSNLTEANAVAAAFNAYMTSVGAAHW
jgi:hypothetical protein